MNLKSITKLIKEDIKKVNKKILKQLKSNINIINQINKYIINNKGKQIRPIIALLTSKALGYKGDDHILIATLVEFIHTATLLHDDVIDKTEIRRGVKNINTIFGNEMSILIGDLIYTKSFKIMIDLNSIKILKLISNTTNTIAEGEILQLINSNNLNITEKTYMQIIYRKTACLFEATTCASAIISGANKIYQNALKKYGKYFGIAFQLINDILDYKPKNNCIKNCIGNDFKEGKITLPIFHIMKNSSKNELSLIKSALKNKKNNFLLNKLLILMKKYRSLEYTKKRAKEKIKKAVNSINLLPNSIYKEALINLAKLFIK